jgi:hypothetical protein
MRKLAVLAAVVTVAALVTVAGTGLLGGGSARFASADLGLAGEQADSVHFERLLGESTVVYCGVATNAEPYVLDVAVRNPPQPLNDPDPSPSHEGAGWLNVGLQEPMPGDPAGGGKGVNYLVPTNDSFSFSLTLGGRPGGDQIVKMGSPPKGAASGGGAPFAGLATVRAQKGAKDPFIGDGRQDNFCVSIGTEGEFAEGAISTKLPVPDQWVTDCDGSNGGILRGAALVWPWPPPECP